MTHARRILVAMVMTGALTLSPRLGIAQQSADPDARAQEVIQEACSVCHSPAIAFQFKRTESEWEATLADMIGRGAALREGEREIILQFLVKNHSPDQPKTNINEASPEELMAAFALSKKEAGDLVRYRDRNGKFLNWQDLRELGHASSIDLKKLEARKDVLVFF